MKSSLKVFVNVERWSKVVPGQLLARPCFVSPHVDLLYMQYVADLLSELMWYVSVNASGEVDCCHFAPYVKVFVLNGI